MRKVLFLTTVVLIVLLTGQLWAGSYQYLSAAETKEKLAQQVPIHLVDIQVEAEFSQHHLPGAIATYAYPVKSDQELAQLDATLPQLKATGDAVVIVCPRGGGGAKRAYDHLQSQGIAAARLFILEKGQQGWPYPELLTKKQE